MNLARYHPAIEATGGGFLGFIGTAIHFANDWLTPALSFVTAAIGFFFAIHGAMRFIQGKREKRRRKED
jgi:predicted tellurium resistance membrane protein TerC